MNDVHLHLVLNHLPVVDSVVAAALLVAALILRQPAVRRLAMVATVLVALSGIPAYLSGGRAEEAVENQPGIALLSRTATLGGEIAHPEIRGEDFVPVVMRSTP